MRPRSGRAWAVHAAALAVLLSPAFLSAQDRIDPSEVSARTSPYVPPSQYRLRTEARLVDVGVVVRDKRGRAVSGLQKRDFEIRDEGKNREIKAFTIQTFTPPGSSREQSQAPETRRTASGASSSAVRWAALRRPELEPRRTREFAGGGEAFCN